MSPVGRTGAAALAACTVAGALAAAFQSPPGQRPPVFRAGANFVLVDAYPHRDGRIVEGLTAADFEVLEDGRPQAIESVEFVRVEPGLSESTRRDPNNTREMYDLASDPHNRVFVAFLDVPHVSVDGSHAIRRPLVDALNRIMAPEDLFGILTPAQRPTDLVLGRRLLSVEEQLTRYWPWGERHRLGLDPADPMEQYLEYCFRSKPTATGFVDWYVPDGAVERFLFEVLIDRRREDRSLGSLENLVTYLGGLREARSIVILVTEGWVLYTPDRALAEEAQHRPASRPGVFVDGRGRLAQPGRAEGPVDATVCNAELLRLAAADHERRFRALFAQANHANVSFYPVTPGGLAASDTPISVRQWANPRAGPDQSPVSDMFRRIRDRVDNLRTLAEHTDGLAIVNTNDLDAGLRRIVEDVSAYYLIGYYSTNTAFDGGLRRIQVRVKTPDVTVRARRGYLAPTEAAMRAREGAAAGVEPEATLVEDAFAALPRQRPGPDLLAWGVVTPAELRVAAELTVTPGAGTEVRAAVTDEGGRALGTATGRLEPGERGVLLALPRPLAPGPFRVTVTAGAGVDRLQDQITVAEDDGRLVGPPVLYRGTPSARSPLRPVADFQFRRSERLHVEWPVLAELDRREARLLGRNGQPLAVPVTLTEREQAGATTLAADVVLAPLAEGQYAIDLVAGAGAGIQRRVIAFRVIR